MSTLTSLFDPPSATASRYVALLDITPDFGPHGRFVRLLCDNDEGATLEATAEESQFPLLEPYHELLCESRCSAAVETPVVPIVLDRARTWRFSSAGAQLDYPELAPPHRSPRVRLPLQPSRRWSSTPCS